VKGRNQGLQQRAPAHKLFHALCHLARCLVREGDRQDGIRRDACIFYHVGNAVGNGARLAAACTGQDQHRPFNGLCRLALLGIEFV